MAEAVATFTIQAVAAEIRNAACWVSSVGEEFGVPAEQLNCLDICLNEALANVLEHGGSAARAAPIRLDFAVRQAAASREAAITVSDEGTACDPLGLPSRTRPQSLAEAEPGGLGVSMMRTFADALSYRYSEGRNQLTFAVRWRTE
ncbi:ATP-binding protein [Pseudomonas sp. N040]|uniref:ATP-binding protein n=1 Tax=Pseudomonas sp. N040 TaxID=2785325 RepID=UPI0018A30738|nr:ATP-binding protein [Pseudomonas sp. N040]MBF7728758.1 ATP-binding protein [Pseudomonas sp. N040]MBW7012398.1 ATP-binding protein [Pseudomonas sp. N040]